MISIKNLSRSLQDLAFFAYKTVGHHVPAPWRGHLAKAFYRASNTKPKTLTVDISGSCNLRCPSCPVGSIGAVHPTGFMEKELFTQIVRKARDEHGVRIVALHNWTEPFLHPQLPAFIRIVKEAGLICMVSTNLSIRRNIEEVLEAAPDFLRISVSGFTQESYATTHTGGNIEHIKQNMRLLGDAYKAGNKRSHITVFYHKYQHNLQEMQQMRSYTKELGFAWEETWAYYMSLEKVTALLEGKLSAQEQDFVDNRLALPIAEAVQAAQKLPTQACSLLRDQLVLDHMGNINLCCAVYDQQANRLGQFMAMDNQAIAEAKRAHPTCTGCMKQSLYMYFTYYDIPPLETEYARLASARARPISPDRR